MPPQQPDRLLDLIDDGLNLGAHGDACLNFLIEHDLARKSIPIPIKSGAGFFGSCSLPIGGM